MAEPVQDLPQEVTSPIWFAERVLGFTGETKMYWWQDQVLTWFENTLKRTKVSLATPNGSGKSSVLIPVLVLWWLFVHRLGRVVITTKDSKQLDNQIWPGLKRHEPKFPGWRWIEREIHNGSGGFCVGFTTDEPGRAEGWHKVDNFDGPLLIICDEAKSIPDPIFQAFDRCTFNGLLYVSSPGMTVGTFYESQTKISHNFKRLQIGLKDCPHIPDDRITDLVSKWGIDHPFIRSTLFGEFVDAMSESMFIIPRSAVRALLETPPSYEHGPQSAFCDFAAGGDENVLAHKIGNRVMPLVCWKDENTMATVARFVVEFKKRGLQPSEIWADAGGLGKPIVDRLEELGWPINRMHNEERARDDKGYEHRAAEIWHEGSRVIQDMGIILPNDDILVAQLCTRKTKRFSDGRLSIESKKEMRGKDRNLPSPDRAEAVLGAMAVAQHLASTLFDRDGLRALENAAQPSRPELGGLESVGDSVVYQVTPPDPWLNVWERPIIGLSYLAVLNPARHSEPQTDHSVMILRVAYGEGAEYKPTRLVAKVRTPCRLSSGPLVETTMRLIKWYGDCPIVPIVSDRGDIVDGLLQAGATVDFREDFERLKAGGRSSDSIVFGWESNVYNRSLWIGALAEGIRERSVLVEDLAIVMQLNSLSTNNCDIMKDAEAVGVGLKRISQASINRPKRRFHREQSSNATSSMIS